MNINISRNEGKCLYMIFLHTMQNFDVIVVFHLGRFRIKIDIVIFANVLQRVSVIPEISILLANRNFKIMSYLKKSIAI